MGCHRMCESIMTNIIVTSNLTISYLFQSFYSARSGILVSAVLAKASIGILAYWQESGIGPSLAKAEKCLWA